MQLTSTQARVVVDAAESKSKQIGVPVNIAVVDPAEMIERMVEIVPSDTGKFRNVVPKFVEDMLKAHQLAAWAQQI